jgi:hypothetical protein
VNERMVPTHEGVIPPALAARIAGDLRPVRPVRSAETRSVAVIAIAAIAAAILVWAIGMRHDLRSFASPWFLAMLLARIAAGALLIVLALQDAIPGTQGIGARMKIAAVFGVAAVLALPPLFAASLAPTPGVVGPSFCFPLIIAVALPSFVGLLWLLLRAYPLHPLRTAAAAGLGSGVLAEAAQFVACSNANAAHGSLVHGGAAITLAVLGGVAGWIIAARRRRELSFP